MLTRRIIWSYIPFFLYMLMARSYSLTVMYIFSASLSFPEFSRSEAFKV